MISEALRRSAGCFSAALIGSLAVAGTVEILQDPTYKSSMQILVEPNAGRPDTLASAYEETQPVGTATDIDTLTEIRLMRSSKFVQQAIESLEREQPTLCRGKAVRADCVKDFQDRLTITQLKEGRVKTRVVEVVFTGSTKKQTLDFLLALQKLYRMYNVQQQEERMNDRLAIFDNQVSTGEQVLLQAPQTSPRQYPQDRPNSATKALLAVDSGQSDSLPTEGVSETTQLYQLEGIPTEADFGQLLNLRQKMADDLIRSGFTWELVAYPMAGRRVFPELWLSLAAGLILGPLLYELTLRVDTV